MQFLLYCLCGGIGVLSDYSLFYLTFMFGMGYQTANAIGYLTGTLISFVLNRKITFGMHDYVIRRLVLFLSVAGLGYLTSALVMWFLVNQQKIDAYVAKLLTLPVVIILQFSLNRFITFRQSRGVLSIDQ